MVLMKYEHPIRWVALAEKEDAPLLLAWVCHLLLKASESAASFLSDRHTRLRKEMQFTHSDVSEILSADMVFCVCLSVLKV